MSGESFDDEITDDPFKNGVMGFIDSVDTMIIGANTCAQSKDYWPYADEQGQYGEKFNNLLHCLLDHAARELQLDLDDGEHWVLTPTEVIPAGVSADHRLLARPCCS